MCCIRLTSQCKLEGASVLVQILCGTLWNAINLMWRLISSFSQADTHLPLVATRRGLFGGKRLLFWYLVMFTLESSLPCCSADMKMQELSVITVTRVAINPLCILTIIETTNSLLSVQIFSTAQHRLFTGFLLVWMWKRRSWGKNSEKGSSSSLDPHNHIYLYSIGSEISEFHLRQQVMLLQFTINVKMSWGVVETLSSHLVMVNSELWTLKNSW